MDFRVLGIISALLLLFNISFFVMRRIYKYSKHKTEKGAKFLKVIKKVHIVTGITLVFTGLIHGLWALGWRLQFHTGTILWFTILLMFIGYLFRPIIKKKGKKWTPIHRTMGFIALGLLALHYFFPWLF